MNIAEEKARKNLDAVYRLVHHFGWDDTIFTHISAKISGTEEFLINEFGLLFNEVTADNLVKVDINGTVISGGIINPAGFVIHSAIHEARPEVSCIVHTHTRDGVAVSADRRGLMPISQQAGIVKQSLAYHDYFGIATDTNEREWLQKDLQDKKAFNQVSEKINCETVKPVKCICGSNAKGRGRLIECSSRNCLRCVSQPTRAEATIRWNEMNA